MLIGGPVGSEYECVQQVKRLSLECIQYVLVREQMQGAIQYVHSLVKYMRVPELCVCIWYVRSDLALPVHFLLVFYWLLLAFSPG